MRVGHHSRGGGLWVGHHAGGGGLWVGHHAGGGGVRVGHHAGGGGVRVGHHVTMHGVRGVGSSIGRELGNTYDFKIPLQTTFLVLSGSQ